MPEDDEINFKRDEDSFSPREEKIRAWRKKRADEARKNKEEHSKKLSDISGEIARRDVEKEEKRELSGPVQATPISEGSSVEIPAEQPPGGILKKQRRSRKKKFDAGHTPGLFDEVE